MSHATGVRQNEPDLPLGITQGRLDLPAPLLAWARRIAARTYRQAVAQDWCGYEVEDVLPTQKISGVLNGWLPVDALSALGLRPSPAGRRSVYATADAGWHVDDMDGLSLIVVLHNDGCAFAMRGVHHRAVSGQWFLLDDRQPHRVRGGRHGGAFVCWSVALQRCRLETI